MRKRWLIVARASGMQLKMAIKDNVHSQLAQNIGQQILSGVYAPGAILPNEADWCRIYSASRTSVREAIKTLNAKGLLKSRPKIGSRVEPRENWNLLDRDVLRWHGAAKDPQEFLRTVQEVRRILEPEAAALAAERRTPAQLAALAKALQGMRDARSHAESVAPDVAFHIGLLSAANNDILTPFGIVIESALATLFEYTTTNNPAHAVAIDLHENIFKAIRLGNPKSARKAALILIGNTDEIVAQKRTQPRSVKRTATRSW
jgi:DNA-binding FadR family transcriptional regulator